MLFVQDLMLDMLVDEEVVLNENEIFTQVLGGKRSGHVKGNPILFFAFAIWHPSEP
jgi:hypothetical protein